MITYICLFSLIFCSTRFLFVLLQEKETNTCYFEIIEGVKEFEARWIGWAGVNVPDEAGQKALTKALAEKVHC